MSRFIVCVGSSFRYHRSLNDLIIIRHDVTMCPSSSFILQSEDRAGEDKDREPTGTHSTICYSVTPENQSHLRASPNEHVSENLHVVIEGSSHVYTCTTQNLHHL